ncbi:hypothetical protein C8Q76DRAFT_630506, partial [Earliella scabrosa]
GVAARPHGGTAVRQLIGAGVGGHQRGPGAWGGCSPTGRHCRASADRRGRWRTSAWPRSVGWLLAHTAALPCVS